MPKENIKFNKRIDKVYSGTEIIVFVDLDYGRYFRTYLILLLSGGVGDNRESSHMRLRRYRGICMNMLVIRDSAVIRIILRNVFLILLKLNTNLTIKIMAPLLSVIAVCQMEVFLGILFIGIIHIISRSQEKPSCFCLIFGCR